LAREGLDGYPYAAVVATVMPSTLTVPSWLKALYTAPPRSP
jgi:hypothetical protein